MTTELSTRPLARDLIDLPPDPPAEVVAPPASPSPQLWDHAPAAQIVQAVKDHQVQASLARGAAKPHVAFEVRGAELTLAFLATQPGETWTDRWALVEASTSSEVTWLDVARPGEARDDREVRKMRAGLTMLLVLDVLRPSYAWLHHQPLIAFRQLGEYRDPEGTAAARERIDQFGSLGLRKQVQNTLAKLQLHTGKGIRQITAEDLLAMDADLEVLNLLSKHRRVLDHTWQVLADLGWLDHPSPVWPRHRTRTAQLSPQQVVDRYAIPSPQREVLIEYLKQRRATTDYAGFRNNAVRLVKDFWLDIITHHPDLPSFALTREMADGWKERLHAKQPGAQEDKAHIYNKLFLVRSFYLDLANWALEDSYWAPWAAASPISRAEVKNYSKVRRRQIARTQQRTRQLAPVLPQLVAQAEKERRSASQLLADATRLGAGGQLTHDGVSWTVVRRSPTSPIQLERPGSRCRDLNGEDEDAFWTWAIVETLRLTGVRSEELLELTHMAIVPYRVPATGEEIALLHIVPSKTAEERLLVAGPELVNVLSAVIHRIRQGREELPLTQRWDKGRHQLSDLQPHLFCRWVGPVFRPITPSGALALLRRLAERADIRVDGEPAHFTTHDFRRVFATEALASGLPPHIVQALLGHKSIATTQIYAAVYPQDVIRHHRTWIAQRRLTRPSEEYRQPTPAEWEEFEGHFVKRKVSLGTCGRAYGTNCHHEHACVRCALLRPDPAQIDRFRDIVDNLRDRISEAEQNAWLGEVEGLRISLSAAEAKLAGLVEDQTQTPQAVLLPQPSFPRYQDPSRSHRPTSDSPDD